jgi:hypothetical protein
LVAKNAAIRDIAGERFLVSDGKTFSSPPASIAKVQHV